MQFTYRAKQGRQAEASGVIEAVDLSAAVQHLKQMGLFPLEVVPLEQKASFSSAESGRALSRSELSLWARTLGQGIAAGLSLTQALHLLGTQEQGRPVGYAASQLEKQVTAGMSLADAMERMNPPFSPVAVSLIRAGETSGALEEVFEALAVEVEGEDDLISKVKAAFAYPIFVLLVGFGFMLFSNWVVLPRLVALFQETGQTLPLMTRLMMGFVSTFAWVIVLLIIAGFAVFAGIRWGGWSLPVGVWTVAVLSRLPLFGRMIAQMDVARMSATLGLLLEHGLPLPESLRLVSETIPRARLKDQILQTRRGVVEGVSVSEGLRRAGMVEPFLMTIVTMGEAQGDLGRAFIRAGLRYHQEVDRTIKVLSTLIEPLLIVLVAIILGGVIISMILPIFQINFTAS